MPYSSLSQVIEGPWTFEVGASSINAFTRSSSFNLRYISPRFKWSNEELSEEEEKKNGELYRNTRLMLELIYEPPYEVLCTGLNVQSRLINAGKFSMDLYGGMKCFIIPGPEFKKIAYLKGGKQFWYFNMGILFQIDLGVIAPFADIGGDKIITVGTELKLHKIYRKPKGRYNLRLKKKKETG